MRIRYAIAGLVAGIAVLFAAGVATAGFAPSNRPTYQCITPTNCPGADHVVFNSFTNAPNYGDERAFFDAKNATNTNPGGFQDQLSVQDGERIQMRVYVHNNANPNTIGVAAATAKNTRLQALLETSNQTSHVAAAQITADNANPATVSDTVDLTGDSPFTMVFDKSAPVQVTYRPNGTGDWVTRDLPNASFSNDTTLNANMGDWKGCFEFSALITFTAVVHMPPPQVPPAFSCDALDVTTSTGRRADASVRFSATNGASLNSVNFNWGDNTTPTITSQTSASHTYSQDGTFTVRSTLSFDVGDTTQTAECSKQVTITTPPVTTVTTPPVVGKSLPNTGSGSVIGLFAGVSAIAGAAHYLWGRRFGRL